MLPDIRPQLSLSSHLVWQKCSYTSNFTCVVLSGETKINKWQIYIYMYIYIIHKGLFLLILSSQTLLKADFHSDVCVCRSGSSNIHCSILWQLVAGLHTLPLFGFLIEPVKYWLSVTEFVTHSARLYLFLLLNKMIKKKHTGPNAIFKPQLAI